VNYKVRIFFILIVTGVYIALFTLICLFNKARRHILKSFVIACGSKINFHIDTEMQNSSERNQIFITMIKRNFEN